MKKSITLLALILSTSSFGQTNIISLKSHSGNLEDIALEHDNFGEMSMPRYFIDSVIFLKPGLYIESKHSSEIFYDSDGPSRFHDTIRDPSITNVLTYTLKRRYGSNVVFVGFKDEKTNMAQPHFEGMKRNGTSSLLMLFEILLFMGLIRRFKFNYA